MTHRGPFQPLPFCDSVIFSWSEVCYRVFWSAWKPMISGGTKMRWLLNYCTLACDPLQPCPPIDHKKEIYLIVQISTVPFELLFGAWLEAKTPYIQCCSIRWLSRKSTKCLEACEELQRRGCQETLLKMQRQSFFANSTDHLGRYKETVEKTGRWLMIAKWKHLQSQEQGLFPRDHELGSPG